MPDRGLANLKIFEPPFFSFVVENHLLSGVLGSPARSLCPAGLDTELPFPRLAPLPGHRRHAVAGVPRGPWILLVWRRALVLEGNLVSQATCFIVWVKKRQRGGLRPHHESLAERPWAQVCCSPAPWLSCPCRWSVCPHMKAQVRARERLLCLSQRPLGGEGVRGAASSCHSYVPRISLRGEHSLQGD